MVQNFVVTVEPKFNVLVFNAAKLIQKIHLFAINVDLRWHDITSELLTYCHKNLLNNLSKYMKLKLLMTCFSAASHIYGKNSTEAIICSTIGRNLKYFSG
jgi:hypothetical protein